MRANSCEFSVCSDAVSCSASRRTTSPGLATTGPLIEFQITMPATTPTVSDDAATTPFFIVISIDWIRISVGCSARRVGNAAILSRVARATCSRSPARGATALVSPASMRTCSSAGEPPGKPPGRPSDDACWYRNEPLATCTSSRVPERTGTSGRSSGPIPNATAMPTSSSAAAISSREPARGAAFASRSAGRSPAGRSPNATSTRADRSGGRCPLSSCSAASIARSCQSRPSPPPPSPSPACCHSLMTASSRARRTRAAPDANGAAAT